MTVSRRGLLGSSLVIPVAALAGGGVAEAAKPSPASADFHWLGDAPPSASGAAVWGAPWPRGAVKPKTTLTAIGAEGQALPLQTWPLAYWPDGSLKWTGHALAGAPAKGFQVKPGKPVQPSKPVVVRETQERIEVAAGDFVCSFARTGAALIESVSLAGRETLRGGRLVALNQNTPPGDLSPRETQVFDGAIDAVTIEQRGPVRAVVRFEGRHRGAGRDWLPFTLRVAVDADGRLTLTHSFTFDGDGNKDFIAGLGIRFDVPLTDELHNRHVRFAGEGEGMWGEAVRNIPGWQPTKFAQAAKFQDQLRGERVPDLAAMDAKTRGQLLTVPAWNGYRLFQVDADAFTIDKQTNTKSSWLRADHGGRAPGLGYVGGVSGGVAFGLRHFWQRHPTGLEIDGATTDAATVTLWLWSPQAGAMDLRHYSDKAHGLEIQYEDVEEGHSTPLGIARTNQVFLWPVAATPTRAALSAMARATTEPALPVAAPAYYQGVGAFGGVFTPVDRSTPVKVKLEAAHDRLLGFYQHEIEQRRWYGFWDHGDVMHTYDQDRHVWRYDVGGYAWANSELVPDLWLWTAFMRTGRADLFRMAEAMTRHTGEVDVHHLGPFKGLGSRHNVSHWGDGAKEARISQSLLRRHYYYLTADERTGDLMADLYDGDHALLAVNPVRKVAAKTKYPTQARSGPDWFAFASNWLVAWERTGDTKWRDKIVKGLDAIAASSHGMFTGPPFGYDPATATLYDLGTAFTTSYHLVTIMGGAELVFELDGLIDDPAWSKAWVRFCAYYNAPLAERQAALGPAAIDRYFAYPVWHARLTAWAAVKLKDPVLAKRAWTEFLAKTKTGQENSPEPITRVTGTAVLNPIDEMEGVSTNQSAQWALNLFELLALVGDAAPDSLPAGWA